MCWRDKLILFSQKSKVWQSIWESMLHWLPLYINVAVMVIVLCTLSNVLDTCGFYILCTRYKMSFSMKEAKFVELNCCCDYFNITIEVCFTRMLTFPNYYLQVDETYRLLGLLATMVSTTSAYFLLPPKHSCFSLDSTNPRSIRGFEIECSFACSIRD